MSLSTSQFISLLIVPVSLVMLVLLGAANRSGSSRLGDQTRQGGVVRR